MGDPWHLDEVFVTIQGRQQYLWRAVDEDGDVLDILVQSHRNRRAAVRFFRTLLKAQGRIPRRLITDQLRSYAAAGRTVMPSVVHVTESVREQSSRTLPPTDASAGAPDAAFHVGRSAPPVRVGARYRAESLPSQSTPPAVGSPPPAPHPRVRRMGCRDVRLLKTIGSVDFTGQERAALNKLTMPPEGQLTQRLFGDMLRRIWALPVPVDWRRTLSAARLAKKGHTSRAVTVECLSGRDFSGPHGRPSCADGLSRGTML